MASVGEGECSRVESVLVNGDRPIKLLLVDDEPLMLDAIETIFKVGSAGEIEVVGKANNGLAAIDAVHAYSPDVILMDIRMPKMDGIEATRRIRSLPNPPEVIVLTTFDSENEPVRAAEAGANGFLLKTEGPKELVGAVKNVAMGEGALSPRTSRQLVEFIRVWATKPEVVNAAKQFLSLTARERDIAKLAAAGQSNTEIADSLFVSLSTVKTHLASIQQKLGVDNRVLIAVTITLASLAPGYPDFTRGG